MLKYKPVKKALDQCLLGISFSQSYRALSLSSTAFIDFSNSGIVEAEAQFHSRFLFSSPLHFGFVFSCICLRQYLCSPLGYTLDNAGINPYDYSHKTD